MAREPRPLATPFAEALDALRRRLEIGPDEWRGLTLGVAAGAGAVADETASQMAEDLVQAVLEVMKSGGTLADFRDRYGAITAKAGWEAENGADWHSRLIFRTQTAVARNAGRWVQIQRLKRVRPYIRYVTAGDERVRDNHALWHGVVLPVDHRFWLTHFPPNGYQCRCYVMSLSERDLARFGWTLTDPADPLLLVPPDDGWTGNVGLAAAR